MKNCVYIHLVSQKKMMVPEADDIRNLFKCHLWLSCFPDINLQSDDIHSALNVTVAEIPSKWHPQEKLKHIQLPPKLQTWSCKLPFSCQISNLGGQNISQATHFLENLGY